MCLHDYDLVYDNTLKVLGYILLLFWILNPNFDLFYLNMCYQFLTQNDFETTQVTTTKFNLYYKRVTVR